MFVVDLCRKRQSCAGDPPADAGSLWQLATNLARTKPEVAVRLPIGPDRRDRAELDGRLLAESQMELF